MSDPASSRSVHDEEYTIRDGDELKRVLRVAGYAQREIAEVMGFSRSYLNSVCRGLSPLTLRVVEAVRRRLGDTLFVLAVKRTRQLEVEEQQRMQARQRQRAIEAEQQRLREQRAEEQRRQKAISTLQVAVRAAEMTAHPLPTEVRVVSYRPTPDSIVQDPETSQNDDHDKTGGDGTPVAEQE